MRRELGIARCGLACCLCGNMECNGCDSGECSGAAWCENRRCSIEKGLKACHECSSFCRNGLLGKIKAYSFSLFVQRYGQEELMDCLERNEKNGIVYHREGITGDYDEFEREEDLIAFIKTGKRT